MSARKDAPKVAPPERKSQAQKADARSALLQAFGIGPVCAAQGAFSRQVGAGPVRPPCEACAPITATFPGPVRSGWALPNPEALSSVPQDVPGVVVCIEPVRRQIAVGEAA